MPISILLKISPYLKEVQKCWFRHASFLNEGHGIGEVIDVIAVYIQHHRLGELWEIQGDDRLENSFHKVMFIICFVQASPCNLVFLFCSQAKITKELLLSGYFKGDYRAKKWKQEVILVWFLCKVPPFTISGTYSKHLQKSITTQTLREEKMAAIQSHPFD